MLFWCIFYMWSVVALAIDSEQFFCEQNFSCQRVSCEDCSQGGEKNAAYCQCCDACRQKNVVWRNGCLEEQKRRRSLVLKGDEYADNLWIPDCDIHGNYQRTQRKRHMSFCMAADGKKLFGKQVLSHNMRCECSEKGHSLEVCTQSGDFEQVQCQGNVCYCTESSTGQVEGRLVPKEHVDKLFCYRKNASVKPCLKEFIQSETLHSEFYRKGLDVVGMAKIRCDPDGTFFATQCDTNRCSCTNKKGIQIKSFYTEDSNLDHQMACECARANENVESMQCNRYGNYNWWQCFREDECFCVDEEGDVISKKFNATTAANICFKLWQRLNASTVNTF